MAIQEAQNWIEKANRANSPTVKGNYFQLENGLIKTFLPTGFKRYTLDQYKIKLDSVVSKNEAKNEMRRFEAMRSLQGSLYLFFDQVTGSTYTLNTLPFTPFHRNDAKMILAIINERHEKTSQKTNLTFKKLTAAYKKTKEFTMFRSIYQIDNLKHENSIYCSSYFITAKGQTFMINLTTPFQVNFDSYIEKMKF